MDRLERVITVVPPPRQLAPPSSVVGDVRTSHPLPTAILTGTFVAPASGRAVVTVDLEGNNPGIALANLGLVLGVPNGGGRLRGAGQYAPLIAGAIRRRLGRGDLDGLASVHSREVFENLAPGVEHRWNIEATVVGGSGVLNLATPTGVVFLEAAKRGYVFTSDAAGASGIYPLTLGGRPGWRASAGPVVDALGAKIVLPGGPYALYRPAITPNGAFVVAQALLGTGCAILNTATNVVTKVVNPASGTGPYTAVCPNNAEAFVGFSTAGRIAKLDLAAGTWGAPVNPGGPIIGMALDESRTVLYAGRTDGVVLRYPNLADLSVGVTFLDIGGRVEALAWGGDRLWCGLPNELRSIHPTTFATIDSIALASTPNDIALDARYEVVWTMLQNGVATYYSTAHHPSLPPNNAFDAIDLGAVGAAVDLTTDGYIYTCVDSKVTVWPGATLGVLADSGDGPGGLAPDFLDHGLTVTVTDT